VTYYRATDLSTSSPESGPISLLSSTMCLYNAHNAQAAPRIETLHNMKPLLTADPLSCVLEYPYAFLQSSRQSPLGNRFFLVTDLQRGAGKTNSSAQLVFMEKGNGNQWSLRPVEGARINFITAD